MVAELQLDRMWVEVVLVLEILDAVLDDVVPEHRHRHDQRDEFPVVVLDLESTEFSGGVARYFGGVTHAEL